MKLSHSPTVVTALCWMIASPAALATIIVCPDDRLNDSLDGPRIIFRGTVESTTKCTSNDQSIRYRVDTLYKGTAPEGWVDIACEIDPFEGTTESSVGAGTSEIIFADCYGCTENSVSRFRSDYCLSSDFARFPEKYWPRLDRYRLALRSSLMDAEAHPHSKEKWLAVLELQEKRADHLGALESLEKLRALGPNSQDYQVRLADQLRLLDRHAAALQAYDRALQLGEHNRAIDYGRSRALIALKRFAEVPYEWNDFSGAEIEKADFKGRHLSGASFDRAYLNNCNLGGASLISATFVGTGLRGTDLSGADLRGSRFQPSSVDESKLQGVDLSGGDLRRAGLYGAAFANSNFTKADLRQATLINANLTGARFNGARLSGVHMTGSNLTGADLREADLSLADLRGADLTNAQVSGANLRLARFDCQTHFPDNFDSSELIREESPGCVGEPAADQH